MIRVIQPLLESAMQHHQAGRLQEAEALYRQVLDAEPEHAQAMQLLGWAVFQSGRAQEALEVIRRAIAIDQNRAESHYSLGAILAELKRHAEAAQAYQRALQQRPDFPEAAYNLAAVLHAMGDSQGAIAAYEQTLRLRPSWAEAHNNLANILQQQGRLDEAEAAFRQAVALQPHFAQAWYNLGNALRQRGRRSQAIDAFHQALAAQPSYPEAYNNLGNTLNDDGQLGQATVAYRQALALRPVYPEVYRNLAKVLFNQDRVEDAISLCRQGLRLCPDEPELHATLSILLLQRGEYPEAWREYEWRVKATEPLFPNPRFSQTMWDGSDLAGRRILLHPEGGYGDALHFVRYCPVVARRGGRVRLLCQPDLLRLFESVGGVEQVAAVNQPWPEFDVHCPLLSVPLRVGTTLQSIPAEVPYLHPQPKERQQWQSRLAALGRRLNVGLVWSGDPGHDTNINRAVPIAELAALGQVPSVRLFSLQKGPPGQQRLQLPQGMEVTDWTAQLHDWADTAALTDNLDVIVTVDTAMAHLAGALAKPVWVLLPRIGEWRWLSRRTDSPWYPTMRLFRQSTRGDWTGPIRQIVQALQEWVQQRG